LRTTDGGPHGGPGIELQGDTLVMGFNRTPALAAK